MPTISVIVPVYNAQKYIHRCVDSILAQTFSDFELILVDDGSPDNCGAICDEYAAKDSRIRVIHQENGGVSKARNAALEIMNGEYVAFCDSDDYWLSDFLKQMIACADEYCADMVLSNYTAVDERDSVLWRKKNDSGLVCVSEENNRVNYIICKVLGKGVGWEVCIKLFRSKIIREKQIRFCTTCDNYAEDAGFILQFCLYATRIYGSDYDGYRYFIRPTSMVQSSKGIAKINEKNEVSAYFGKFYFNEIKSERLRALYPIIHYRLTCGEYEKLLYTGKWTQIISAVQKVHNIEWYNNQVKGLSTCKKYLVEQYGFLEANQAIILSDFCIHKNRIRFRLERAICNRLLSPWSRKRGFSNGKF